MSMRAFRYFSVAMLALVLRMPVAAQGVERTAQGVRLDVQGGKFKCEVMFSSVR